MVDEEPEECDGESVGDESVSSGFVEVEGAAEYGDHGDVEAHEEEEGALCFVEGRGVGFVGEGTVKREEEYDGESEE